MIDSIEFRNFKVLRNATLPLGRVTLLVGPNGSGKTTALQALRPVQDLTARNWGEVRSAESAEGDAVLVRMHWGDPYRGAVVSQEWTNREGPGGGSRFWVDGLPEQEREKGQQAIWNQLSHARVYAFDARKLVADAPLQPGAELRPDGTNLVGALDRLRDEAPERFGQLCDELGRLLPEYDTILFDTPSGGNRSFGLRTRDGKYRIPARDLSQGTLLALAVLMLAHLPAPPPILGLEEPDRGIHPRLLRDVQDALYRLAYPENAGDKREPVQVIATTHSPYMLDLFRDHPEEIVIANKLGSEARFERLSDRSDIDDILEGGHLGEVWYTGILGGVPTRQ